MVHKEIMQLFYSMEELGAVTDLYSLADDYGWGPFPASIRFLANRWRSSRSLPERVIATLKSVGLLTVAVPSDGRKPQKLLIKKPGRDQSNDTTLTQRRREDSHTCGVCGGVYRHNADATLTKNHTPDAEVLSNTGESPPAAGAHSSVERIYEQWAEAHFAWKYEIASSNGVSDEKLERIRVATLTSGRKKAISAALKCYSVTDILLVIEYAFSSSEGLPQYWREHGTVEDLSVLLRAGGREPKLDRNVTKAISWSERGGDLEAQAGSRQPASVGPSLSSITAAFTGIYNGND